MNLDRLIQVLETVAIAGKPVSPAEVQRVTGIPRPTCYRLLQDLANHRLLDQPGDASRYLVGDRLKRIVLLGQSDADICLATAPTLQEAAIEFGEAVFLSRFRDKTVEIINVKTPIDAARSFIHPGLGNRPLSSSQRPAASMASVAAVTSTDSALLAAASCASIAASSACSTSAP